MNYRIVSEAEFKETVKTKLAEYRPHAGCVVGPGRSGAVAAVYVSHQLGIPFIPYGQAIPNHLHPVLVVDTATWTGRTMRKAARKYKTAQFLAFYKETPGYMVKFWYEEKKDVRRVS